MNSIRRFFLLTLIISPLFSITGGNEFSTGLNLSSLLNLPSLNGANYVLLILFFVAFVSVNADQSNTNRVMTIVFMMIFLITFWRHPTFYAFVGMISLFSCLMFFMEDRAGVTNTSGKHWILVYNIYWIYIWISIAVHFFLVGTSVTYFANDRMMGIFKNPNQLAFFVVGVYIMHQAKIRYIKTERFPLFRFCIILLLIILTGSRAALVCILLVHFAAMLIQRRMMYITVLVGLSFVAATVLIGRVGYREFVELISRRDAVAVETVGNERWNIFVNIVEKSSPLELAIGKDVSVGTNGMIYEQKSDNRVIWLDSLVAVILYNWGFLGLTFFVGLIVLEIMRPLPYLKRDYLVLMLYIVGALFFVITDFFPLGFLIIQLRNSPTFERT